MPQSLKQHCITLLCVSYLAVALMGCASGMNALARKVIYQPDPYLPPPYSFGLQDLSAVELTTEDQLDLTMWHLPASSDKPTIVFFHGNAGNISHRVPKLTPFANAGYGLLLVEYRGYGGNPGRPSEAGLYRDGRAAIKYLTTDSTTATEWILYGESLGSGVAVQMAKEFSGSNAPIALILEAPFRSMTAAVEEHVFSPMVPDMVEDKYDSLSKIGQLDLPLLIIHGERDRVVPVNQGRDLYERAKHPKLAHWIPLAGHNDLYKYGAAHLIMDYLANCQPECG